MKTKRTPKKTVKKRGRPRKTTTKSNHQSSFLQKYAINVIGGIVAILALLGLLQAGIVGTFMINVARIFVGSLYPLLLLLAIVGGIWLAGFSRLPKIPARYTWGTVLVLIGILLWLTLIEYIQAAQPVDFINFNWEKLTDDIASSNSDSNIGGGILAAVLFYVSHLLFGKIGTGIVASLIILCGGFVLFDISFAKIFTGLRACLTFMKARIAKARQHTGEKRAKQPVKPTPATTQDSHTQVDDVPDSSDNQPNKLSPSTITISGMPVTEETKQAAQSAPKKPAPKEDKSADESSDVDLVDVKEDDSYKLPTLICSLRSHKMTSPVSYSQLTITRKFYKRLWIVLALKPKLNTSV